MFPSFNVARVPQIIFGAGKFNTLPNLLSLFGHSVLFVTGAGSYNATGAWDTLLKNLQEKRFQVHHEVVRNEPTPEFVDEVAAKYRPPGIAVVVSIGGGSAIDAGKAISAMIPQKIPVMTLLEGVGTGATHNGQKIPFIAIPTTAGTGSETTKNAVLRRVGSEGFKNSLRHDNLVPDIALVDPDLHVSCPSNITVACGLDAFTQLLEAFTSNAANPFTDALALSGLEYVQQNLTSAAGAGAVNVDVRARMAYGALLSGIVLANAGLGVVHGFASAIGGLFDIPHGIVCGSLLAAATQINILILKNKDPTAPALEKYARVGRLWAGGRSLDIPSSCDLLVRKLREWEENLKIPKLGTFGIKEHDVEKILAKTSNKNNPITLSRDQMRQILEQRI